MTKDRLCAFSDGVIAIIITIMVLELKAPQRADWGELFGLLPIFLSYVLSFLYVAIYWNNHHHLLHMARRVDGLILWANIHLLFWLSLIPFATAWLGENRFMEAPTALYGASLLMPAIAYALLQRAILRTEGADSALARALGRDVKGKSSVVFYGLGIALAFKAPYLSDALYFLVALMWLAPDRRIERIIEGR